jgi:protein TonB
MKDRSRYPVALLLSLVFHIAVSSYYFYKSKNIEESKVSVDLAQKIRNAQTVKLDSVKFITHKQLLAIKDAQKKQIVANELNGKKVQPKNSRFAGESDQTFDRQTIALKNGTFKEAGLGIKEGSLASTDKTQETIVKKSKLEKIKHEIPKAMTLSELGTIHIDKIEDEEKSKNLEEQNKKNILASKNPSAIGLERGKANITGFASNNDFVEDVPLGDMTNLNTTEFKYYSFYHRIRQRLEQYWGSTIQSKAKNLYKSGRRLPSSENLITAITVTLDDHGNILEIKIDGTSGIRELDQAAIESFNKAGPFPNPPKGLLIGGRAVIQWGFVVKS